MTKHTKTYISEVNIPENVHITKQNDVLLFSGPLGSTEIYLKKIDPSACSAVRVNKSKIYIVTHSKSYHGLVHKLLLNKIQGVTRGFLIYLKLVGIGYRVHIEKNTMFFKLGYSHDITYNVPLSIRVFLLDPTYICLFGIDKNQLSQVAAKIRNLRKPSAYKGKGIRLIHEKIALKTGKRK